MPELITGFALIGIVGWIAWTMTAGRTVFVVRVKAGQATAQRGRTTPAFLAEVTKLSGDAEVQRGQVWGVRYPDGRIGLRFSSSFPLGSQQQLRNWWNCNGWSTSPNRSCRSC